MEQVLTTLYADRNLCVFSLDNDAWVVQGRYNAAIQGGGDKAAWAFKDNKYNLSVLCVCILTLILYI